MVMVVARLLFRSSSVCILLCCFNDGYILSCRKCQMEGKRALVGHGISLLLCHSLILQGMTVPKQYEGHWTLVLMSKWSQVQLLVFFPIFRQSNFVDAMPSVSLYSLLKKDKIINIDNFWGLYEWNHWHLPYVRAYFRSICSVRWHTGCQGRRRPRLEVLDYGVRSLGG